MHVQSQPMAKAVVECITKSRIDDVIASDGINIAHASARTNGRNSALLGTQNDLVNLFDLGRDATDEHHSGQIAAVEPNTGTPVE